MAMSDLWTREQLIMWYMDNKKLPPLNEITIWKNRFKGDKNRYSANAQIIIDVYKRLKTI